MTQVRLAATELNNVVTYTVIIEAENEGRKLFPGMTANVAIDLATRATACCASRNDAFRFKPQGTAPRQAISATASARRARGDALGGAWSSG